MSLIIFTICFIVLFLLGMPIAFAMIASSLLYAILNDVNIGFLGMQMFSALNNFTLVAIPLFILTAEVMSRTSVASRIFRFANAFVGNIRGGLGHVNVVTSIIFSGMSGSAIADVGGIGHLSYQAMVDEGYDKEFSASVTIASSIVGPIIPPSIPMVTFAMVTGTSIAKLFLGGIIPGILFGLVLMVYIYIIARKRKYPIQKRPPFRIMITQLLSAFIAGIFPLFTPLILLGGIYFGFVTVTEASVLAVLYTCFLGVFAYRKLGVKEFIDALKSVFITCGPILIVLPAAKVFGYVLTAENVQTCVTNFIVGIAGDNPFLILLLINILFLILGCLSDPIVNIMLFVPIVMPLTAIIGMDPVQVGVMIVFNCMIGLSTPPVGQLLMTVSALEKIEFESLVKSIWPFIRLSLVVLAIIAAVPAVVLALPNLLF